MSSAKKKVPRDIPKDELLSILDEVSEKAKQEAFSLGLPITIARDGQIVKLFPDGSIEIIENLPPSSGLKRKKLTIG